MLDDQAQSSDCAFKDLETSDYVVGQAWARVGSRCFLGDQIRARMDCPDTVKAVRELSQRFAGTLTKLIEDKANGSAVIQMLGNEIPGLIPVTPQGGKVARAAAVSPLIEAGTSIFRTRSTRLGSMTSSRSVPPSRMARTTTKLMP